MKKIEQIKRPHKFETVLYKLLLKLWFITFGTKKRFRVPLKSIYRFYWKHSQRPEGKLPHFGYYRSGDPNNPNEKDWIIEAVR